ncbi:MAG TPA: hypothetical protein VFO85_06755, partial [Vicinamibacteria bacterium]|nr:hypothetical protein [Vicinamibacteria bacterium]
MRMPLWLKSALLLPLAAGLAAAGVDPAAPRWLSAPWAFLDGTAEIAQVNGTLFRAAIDADFDNDGDRDVLLAQAISA